MLKISPLAGCKGSIENVTVGIVVEFEKNKTNMLERNDKERLKNNILIICTSLLKTILIVMYVDCMYIYVYGFFKLAG